MMFPFKKCSDLQWGQIVAAVFWFGKKLFKIQTIIKFNHCYNQ
ncbi:hypothetical protein HMPREF0476_1076 [Kingella kingae ATCC 23330]|uniref:Uncharacterized protein n=1 Tax=Kingella kingae ATCC 23330 TaxID=887327 RepID=F5S793_KINKI|nr:hypothetical protein HMPREF0476_1076 [Kingella kingae ATCC 23330]